MELADISNVEMGQVLEALAVLAARDDMYIRLDYMVGLNEMGKESVANILREASLRLPKVR